MPIPQRTPSQFASAHLRCFRTVGSDSRDSGSPRRWALITPQHAGPDRRARCGDRGRTDLDTFDERYVAEVVGPRQRGAMDPGRRGVGPKTAVDASGLTRRGSSVSCRHRSPSGLPIGRR
jgi:hypothetical protein